MHRLTRSVPLLLIMAVLIAFMASTRAALTTEREIGDLRCQIQQEAIQSLAAQLQEQREINQQLLQSVCELQEQIDEMKFKPRDIDLPVEYQEYTYYSALNAGIEPDIVFEIMWRESGYQVDAVGHNRNGTTDVGLMQINSCNWSWLSDAGIDVHDPYGNIDAGIYILHTFMDKYPMEQAIACYAAGESGMKRGGGYRYARSIIDAIEGGNRDENSPRDLHI